MCRFWTSVMNSRPDTWSVGARTSVRFESGIFVRATVVGSVSTPRCSASSRSRYHSQYGIRCMSGSSSRATSACFSSSSPDGAVREAVLITESGRERTGDCAGAVLPHMRSITAAISYGTSGSGSSRRYIFSTLHTACTSRSAGPMSAMFRSVPGTSHSARSLVECELRPEMR